MTWRKREIMEMAREAGIRGCTCSGEFGCLKAFAELVREDEAQKYKWDIHSCGPTCTKVACVATREAVQAEREALEHMDWTALMRQGGLVTWGDASELGDRVVAVLRARGQA